VDDDYRRNRIWDVAYETYYYVYFEELLSDTLVRIWSRLDEFAKGILAVTSVASTWAIWQQPTWKSAWAIVAGIGALIAILHLTLGVTHRLRDLVAARDKLLRLRLEMQTFRKRMEMQPNFPIEQFESELLAFRKRYIDDCFKTADLFETNKCRDEVQKFLDSQIT
jgi:hypothetical protein